MGISRQLVILIGLMVGVVLISLGSGAWLVNSISSVDNKIIDEMKGRVDGIASLLDSVSLAQGMTQRLIREKDIDAIEKLVAQGDEIINKAQSQISVSGLKGTELEQSFLNLMHANSEVKDVYLKGDQARALQVFITQSTPAFEKLLSCLGNFQKSEAARLDQEAGNQHSMLKTKQIVVFFAVVLGAVVLISSGWRLQSGISSQLQHIAHELKSAVDSTRQVAGEIASASSSLAESSSREAASVEETSSSVEEILAMTRQNAENAREANVFGSATRSAAEKGGEQMKRMQSAVSEIQQSSHEVSKIIKTIDEIAFQTNILALNAAVEAARAGEAGAGFAVVADEVRNLAQRSATAARETSDKISASIEHGGAGAKVIQEAGIVFTDVLEKARKMDELVGQIVEASKQQSEGIVQINTAIAQIDKSVQSSAGLAEQTATSSTELERQTESLTLIIQKLETFLNGLPADAVMEAALQTSAPVKTSLKLKT